jgi:hypothetical protein
MTLHKALALGLGCALVDLVGASLLDSLGFVEGLLAPSGTQLLLLFPLACAFYGARLITYFALPALAVAVLLFRPRAHSPLDGVATRPRMSGLGIPGPTSCKNV